MIQQLYHFKKQNKMKKVFIILSLSLFLIACKNESSKKHEFIICQHNGSGWSYTFTTCECDSFKMIASKHCIAFYNGSKFEIIADKITIESK